jgi:hypothetical protein
MRSPSIAPRSSLCCKQVSRAQIASSTREMFVAWTAVLESHSVAPDCQLTINAVHRGRSTVPRAQRFHHRPPKSLLAYALSANSPAAAGGASSHVWRQDSTGNGGDGGEVRAAAALSLGLHERKMPPVGNLAESPRVAFRHLYVANPRTVISSVPAIHPQDVNRRPPLPPLPLAHLHSSARTPSC